MLRMQNGAYRVMPQVTVALELRFVEKLVRRRPTGTKGELANVNVCVSIL
jgi:hypothetical protein